MAVSRGPMAGIIGLTLAVLGSTLGSAGIVLPLRAAPVPEPPVAFNHALHIDEEEMECLDCHPDAAEQPFAGLPDIRSCYECHKNPQGEDPAEEIVRDYGKQRVQIPFRRVNRNVGHVYFSHRMHVTGAEMPCADCHPDSAALDAPHRDATEALHSMSACMSCHEQEQATLECIACHQ